MNYFIEGLQGSGKTTLAEKLERKLPDHTLIKEGDYSPIELAWCAYLDEDEYRKILERYEIIRPSIIEKTFSEDDKKIVCYTKIRTDNRDFYKDLEQYEIYNGRTSDADFRSIILNRFRRWNSDGNIFECSLFQNIVEDMILFRLSSDEEIVDFYRSICEVLHDKEFSILYLNSDDIEGNLNIIRKERTDTKGNEMWFDMMCHYFDESPYAKASGLDARKDLIDHFRHRQELELRICKELFQNKTSILSSKNYTDKDISDIISIKQEAA